MTDKEKARKHLEKQNKRLLMLLRPFWGWTAFFLIGIAIVLTIWLMLRAVEPRGPITLQFGSCVAEKTLGYHTLSGEHGVLCTQSGKRYVLSETVSYREMIQDQADGLLRPGDTLTVMWYPWWEDSIAAVASQTKEYGSMGGL